MTKSQSWSFKEYFGGIVGGGVVCGFGIWMLIEPTKAFQEESGSGRGASVMRLIDAVWGTPGGIVLSLLGLAIVGGTIAALVSRGRGA